MLCLHIEYQFLRIAALATVSINRGHNRIICTRWQIDITQVVFISIGIIDQNVLGVISLCSSIINTIAGNLGY